MTDTQSKAFIACPECGEGATEVEADRQDEDGVEFTVAGGGEIVGAKTVALIEYTFHPCGHTRLGTQDQGDGKWLRRGVQHER